MLAWPACPLAQFAYLACEACSAKRTGHSVRCTLYTVHCRLYTVHCALDTVHCTLYTAHCALYTVHCTLRTVHCTLYTAHGRLYTALLRRSSCPRWGIHALALMRWGVHIFALTYFKLNALPVHAKTGSSFFFTFSSLGLSKGGQMRLHFDPTFGCQLLRAYHMHITYMQAHACTQTYTCTYSH